MPHRGEVWMVNSGMAQKTLPALPSRKESGAGSEVTT
jgi:hypothetical protein